MEIEVLKNEKDYIEVALKDSDYGLANMLKEILLEDKDVEFAAARLDHPVAASPVLMVRTSSGTPLSALRSAVKRLRKMATEFKDAVEEAKSASKGAKSKK